MESIFNYLTPILYWVLIIAWAVVLVFCIIKIRKASAYGKLYKLLLIILAIDAFRTFFESVYFGAWFTSFSGILPIRVYDFLANPKVVFIPKIINLIVVVLILLLIFKKWLLYEGEEVSKVKILLEEQTVEITKLRAIINQSPTSIVLTNLDGEIEFVNPKFTEVTGYSVSEAIGKNPSVLNSGKQPKEFYENMWHVIAKGDVWKGDFLNKRKDGSLFWERATISGIKNENGEIMNFLAMKEDISLEKANEKKFLEQKNLFEVMFNAIADAVIITDKDRNIILANDGAEKTLGYKPDDLIGKSTAIFYANKDEFNNIGNKIFDKSSQSFQDFYIANYKHKNGKTFSGETFGTKLFNTDADWIGNLGLIRNIEERVQFINEIKKSKEEAEYSNHLKTEFLKNMSHEIRTPLNGIMGFSELLDEKDITPEKRKNFISIIQNSGKQLLRIIEDILEISKLETRQVTVLQDKVCLNDLLVELFSIFELSAKEKRLPLYLNKPLLDAESTIITDKSKLRKVLSNLLENALKYTLEGFVEFGYELKNNQLEIYVKDTGIGIEETHHVSVFERFSRIETDFYKKIGGLGLGLSIVKENIELLGGTITLNSKKNGGSLFLITLPYKPFYQDDKQVLKPMKKSTILIAEDEEVNFLFLVELIKQIWNNPITIIHAKNGEEAVNYCKTNNEIGLVLMDIKMPIMNGYEAAKIIKSAQPKLPMVAQTAYTTSEERENAIASGINDFISKPINSNKLLAVLKKYISND